MGEIADELIDQMIWGTSDWEYDEREPRVRKEATEVAEERFDEVLKNKKVKDLNKGVIEW